jgi:hypothetical protein
MLDFSEESTVPQNVSPEGIITKREKPKVIRELQTRQTKQKLRNFLRICTYILQAVYFRLIGSRLQDS